MRIYYDYFRQSPRVKKFFELPVGLKDNINLLIFVHLAAFACFLILGGTSLIGHGFANQAIHDQVRDFLALSSRVQDIPHHWLMGLVTYQFIHFRLGELLLSVSMLWLFGHILQHRIGQYKVILYYFALVVISAIVFNLAHVIFPIFAQPGGILDGAFGGVLGVMTTTVYLYGRLRFRFGKSFQVQLWQIYVAALLLSLVLVCKDNIAYILVYASGIYIGIRYGRWILAKEREGKDGKQIEGNSGAAFSG